MCYIMCCVVRCIIMRTMYVFDSIVHNSGVFTKNICCVYFIWWCTNRFDRVSPNILPYWVSYEYEDTARIIDVIPSDTTICQCGDALYRNFKILVRLNENTTEILDCFKINVRVLNLIDVQHNDDAKNCYSLTVHFYRTYVDIVSRIFEVVFTILFWISVVILIIGVVIICVVGLAYATIAICIALFYVCVSIYTLFLWDNIKLTTVYF